MHSLQSYQYIFLGVKTGSATISVRLVSKVYSEKVLPAEIRIVVVANLYLVPQSTYVMIGGIVNYRAEQIKSNKVSKITSSFKWLGIQHNLTGLSLCLIKSQSAQVPFSAFSLGSRDRPRFFAILLGIRKQEDGFKGI